MFDHFATRYIIVNSRSAPFPKRLQGGQEKRDIRQLILAVKISSVMIETCTFKRSRLLANSFRTVRDTRQDVWVDKGYGKRIAPAREISTDSSHVQVLRRHSPHNILKALAKQYVEGIHYTVLRCHSPHIHD